MVALWQVLEKLIEKKKLKENKTWKKKDFNENKAERQESFVLSLQHEHPESPQSGHKGPC